MNPETDYSHFRTHAVPCCVCGGEPHGTFCVKHGMKYVVCSACGHVYIRDQVGEDDLMAIYSNRKSHHHSSEKVAWDYSALKSEFYYDRLLKRIETYVETGRLLDLGCSNGSFVRAAMNRGWDAMGLELESDSVTMAKSMGVPVVRGVLHSQSFADGHFGAVTLWNLFEHLPDPNAVLREIYRILRPGGICAMCVPNIRSIGWYLLGAEWHAVEPQIHLNLFSVRTLSRLVRANGFKIRHIVSADIKPATLQAWTGKRLGRQPCPYAASVAGMARRSPARMKWMFRIRTLTNLPLRLTQSGEDIFCYMQKPVVENKTTSQAKRG